MDFGLFKLSVNELFWQDLVVLSLLSMLLLIAIINSKKYMAVGLATMLIVSSFMLSYDAYKHRKLSKELMELYHLSDQGGLSKMSRHAFKDLQKVDIE